MPAGKDSGGSSQELVSRMADEVDRLLQRHRVELNRCLERWAQSAREPVEPGQLAASSPVADSRQRLVIALGEEDGKPVSFSVDPALQTARALGEVETELQTAREQGTREEEQAMTEEDGHVPKSDASSSSPDPAAAVSQREPTPTSQSNSQGSANVQNPLMSLFSTASRRKPRWANSNLLFATSRSGQGLPPMPFFRRVISSRYFQAFSAILTCLNAIFIGVQTQYLAQRALEAAARSETELERQEPTVFLVSQVLFTILFTVEVVPRWVSYGLIGFFLTEGRWWNLLDACVVVLSMADLITVAVFGHSDILGNFSVARVLRVVRIVRVIRVIRVMSFFRELRMMIFSILRSAKAMVWVILVLSLSFYIFGIIFTVGTYTTLDRIEDWSSEHTADLRNYFGTLDRSFISLFMAMSGGSGEWKSFYQALERLPYPYRLIFLLYMSFTLFAIINIVTGVFVDSALQSNNEDRIVAAHEELDAKQDYLQAMRQVFEEMDDSDSGIVTLEQFEEKLGDERVIAYFNAMGLNISDARKLFILLDGDHSKSIDINEFVDGCYALRGQSRTLDMKIMECQVHSLHDRFTTFACILQRVEEKVSTLPDIRRF